MPANTVFYFFFRKYGLSLTTVRPCTGPFMPCPVACNYGVNSVNSVKCTSFDAGVSSKFVVYICMHKDLYMGCIHKSLFSLIVKGL